MPLFEFEATRATFARRLSGPAACDAVAVERHADGAVSMQVRAAKNRIMRPEDSGGVVLGVDFNEAPAGLGEGVVREGRRRLNSRR